MTQSKKKVVEKLAKKLGGRVPKADETGAIRAALRNKKNKEESSKIPTFKSAEERQKFYLRYIPALYFVEIEGRNPDSISSEEIDFFWITFTAGIEALEKGEMWMEESDMDG